MRFDGGALVGSTARRVAVGYGVGDLNRPEPATVGDPTGRLSVRIPAKAGRRPAAEVCPRARPTKVDRFGEWGRCRFEAIPRSSLILLSEGRGQGRRAERALTAS